MPTKRYKPEQIVSPLRQVEVAIGNGQTTPQASREGGIAEQTLYRWRKEYAGLKLEQGQAAQ
jgi:transposase-like protein